MADSTPLATEAQTSLGSTVSTGAPAAGEHSHAATLEGRAGTQNKLVTIMDVRNFQEASIPQYWLPKRQHLGDNESNAQEHSLSRPCPLAPLARQLDLNRWFATLRASIQVPGHAYVNDKHPL